MVEAVFDDLIHSPLRLRICGLLNRTEAVNFATLRHSLGIADAHLSKQLKLLADAGYISTTRTTSTQREDARRVVWVSLTRTGRAAFVRHVQALQNAIGLSAEQSQPEKGTSDIVE